MQPASVGANAYVLQPGSSLADQLIHDALKAQVNSLQSQLSTMQQKQAQREALAARVRITRSDLQDKEKNHKLAREYRDQAQQAHDAAVKAYADYEGTS